MRSLTTDESRSRLALDYRAMRSMSGAALGKVEAYASPLDVQARREVTDAQGRAGLATVYLVEFRFRMLRSPTEELHSARALFEIPDSGYPEQSPRAQFIGAVPFSPHFHGASGSVCLGEAWRLAGGQWLLANLVVHVMKLANFDEPCTRDGFSAAALVYARQVLRGRPLNPGLDYPVMDERVTHSGGGRAAEGEAPIFRPSAGFAPRARATSPAVPDGFAPRRRQL